MNRIWFLILAICILLTKAPIFCAPNLDSLEKLLQTSNPEKKLKVYADLAWYYKSVKVSKSLIFAETGLKLAKELGNNPYEGELLGTIGAIYLTMSNYDKAIDYYKSAIGVVEKFNDNLSIARYLNNIGVAFKDKGSFVSALDYYNQALRIYKSLGNKAGISSVNTNIGLIYNSLEQFDTALDYLNKSLKIKEEIGDNTGIANALNNIAMIYNTTGKIDKALEYHNKSLAIAREMGDSTGVAISITNIGQCYENKKEFIKAQSNYYYALLLIRNIGDRDVEAQILNNLASVSNSLDKIDEGVIYANMSLAISKELNILENIRDSYFLLYNLYNKNNEPSKALENLKFYTNIKDTLFKKEYSTRLAEETAKRTAEYRLQYELDKYSSETEKSKISANESRLYTFLLIGLALVLLAFAIILYFMYNRLKVAHKEQSNINAKLEKSEKDLKDALALKDKFFSILAHDLRNPLAVFLNVSDFMTNYYSELNDEEVYQFLNDINKASINLFNLLENLLLWAKIQTGSVRYDPELIDMTNLTERVVKDYRELAQKKDVTINIFARRKTIIKADLNMMMTVLKNLVHNAVKFTEKNGEININLSQTEKDTIITVIDNGSGIDPETQSKLFSFDLNKKSKNIHQESGTGLGLILAKEFVEFHKGTLSVQSFINEGSTFTITLPNTELLSE